MDGRERREIPKERYSDEEVVKLLLLSFRFSQGETGLQGFIFEWLKANYPNKILPDFSPSLIKQVKERTKQVVLGSRSRHVKTDEGKLIRDEDAEFQAEIQLDQWKAVYEETEATPDLLGVIAFGIIKRDIYFLSGSNPEIKRTNSFFVDYALKSNHTGSEEFNELFRQVRSYYDEHKDTDEDIKKSMAELEQTLQNV